MQNALTVKGSDMEHSTSDCVTPESLSDRELLHLAAKAAGVYLTIEWLGHQDYQPNWNPLDNDGEALRLAVKLGMFVDVFPGSHIHAQAGGMTERVDEPWNPDPYAATRRAIVRAAAAMPVAS